MNSNINYFDNTEYNDPEWIKELSRYSYVVNDTLTEKDKKIIIELFQDYKIDGFNSLSAMKKAILVFDFLIS